VKTGAAHARRNAASGTPRWYRLSDYFFRRYGEKVWKIPLDAGFSCPNRDGTLSSGGCVFCNPLGSGTGLGLRGLDIATQWEIRRSRFRAGGIQLFIAYLQSFSNTYGPVGRLGAVLDELKKLPDILGLSIGTRPDCVDQEKLTLIADVCVSEGWRERWIEFGVQSSNNSTLTRIRRGHDRACAEKAIAAASAAGLAVCIHLMAGLPGEGKEDFLASVRWASQQAIQGIKFHCLYVCRDTVLAETYGQGGYVPLTQEEYVESMAEALPLLRPDIVIHRITGDPEDSELLAPAWVAANGRGTADKLLAELIRRDARQGGKGIPPTVLHA
jgi:radical SAM protein (TIGR01212 family)